MAMRCATSFLGVVFLVLGVSCAAFFIIWATEETECPPTSFVCEEDGKCVPKRFYCDSLQHCKNGSDEKPTKCKDLTNTYDFLKRHVQGCYTPENSTNTTKASSLPEGCYLDGRSGYCTNGSKWEQIPWDQFGRNILTPVIKGRIERDELGLDDAPMAENQFMKIFIQRNIIRSLANNSLCNIDKVCWLVLDDNSIRDIDQGAFCNMGMLELLDLSRNQLHLRDFQFKDMNNLTALMINHNQITSITDKLFSHLTILVTLKLNNNKISYIHEDAFRYNVKLDELDLSHNRITKFHPLVFFGLRKLKKLNIDYNPLISLQDVFSNLQSLISLNLSGIDQDAIDIKSFESMPKLDMVYFEKFQFCRFVPYVSRCFPNTDGLSSTEDLLIGKTLRMVVWVVALLTIIGNIMVLASRWYNRRGRILDVFINNLAGADFLMGIYLLVLAIKDAQFRFAYNIHAYKWTTSFVCSAIGILAMISSEVSLLILTLMSLERYLVISVPFSNRQNLTVGLARLSVVIIWVFVIALALVPAVQWQGKTSFYGSTGLCFPLHLDDAYSIGWQYTAFVFIGINTVCLLLITFSYGKLFYIIRQTRLSTPVEVNKDMEMAFRFFLMVFTDLLCWTPIVILKIVVMYGHQLPKEVITWVLILVLPFSSLVNPLLYTFSTAEVRIKIKRWFTFTMYYAQFWHRDQANDFPLHVNIGTTATENSRSNIPDCNGAPNWNDMIKPDKVSISLSGSLVESTTKTEVLPPQIPMANGI